ALGLGQFRKGESITSKHVGDFLNHFYASAAAGPEQSKNGEVFRFILRWIEEPLPAAGYFAISPFLAEQQHKGVSHGSPAHPPRAGAVRHGAIAHHQRPQEEEGT